MAFNLINVEEKQFFNDKKKINIIGDLKEKVVLLGPDKGNGEVVMDKVDYKESTCFLTRPSSGFYMRTLRTRDSHLSKDERRN